MRLPENHRHRTARRNGPHSTDAARVGLARALSKLGLCSRSAATNLIHAGRVKLNGAVRRDAETPVHLDRDHIEVDGSPVQAVNWIYWMLNKPCGIVTTAADEKGRDTVYDCLPDSFRAERRWLAPVGRLDKASEGLLLLTNDTEWAARITAPESHIDKTYHVQVAMPARELLLDSLLVGVRNQGQLLRAKRASLLRYGRSNTWLEIVLDEGKNRQIRRMFESLGIDVLRLIRVAIGPVALGDLAKGAARPLAAAEKQLLDRALRRT